MPINSLPQRILTAAAGLLFAAGVVLPVVIIRPFTVGPVGPDAAAPVIEFERLLAGQRLEGYLSQTSKPLLTVVYGLAWSVAHDWRLISFLAILAFALAVVLAALLANRLAGPFGATFVGLGLLLVPSLLLDVALAYGLAWELLLLMVAGLAVTSARPRYALAGVALALGALARPEALAVTIVALAALGTAFVAARLSRRSGPSRTAWWIALGLLAVPILSLHDWALTGDALFWFNTAATNSHRAGGLMELVAVLLQLARRLWHMAPLVLLGAIGLATLLARGRWAAAAVVLAVPIGVGAFYVAAGARGTLISPRYFVPVDLGVLFAAGVGLGTLDVPALRHAARRVSRRYRIGRAVPTAAAVALAAMVAAVLLPAWPRDRAVLREVAHERDLHANAQKAFAFLSGVLAPVPSWRGGPVPAGSAPIVLIPPRLRAQGVVDLDLPLWAAQKSFAIGIDPEHGVPAPGTVIYHDNRDDHPDPTWTRLEVTGPITWGQLRFVPLFVDAKDGIWILRVEAAG